MATQSYTIYIRYPNRVSNNKCKPNTSGGEDNNVKPTNIPTSEEDNGSNGGGGMSIGGTLAILKNPLGTLLGGVKNAYPGVSGALIAIKIADQIVETALPYYEGYTGDYRPSFNYANAKAMIGAIMNPTGTLNSLMTRQMEIYRQNLKIEQTRMLTGNSIVNIYGGKASN